MSDRRLSPADVRQLSRVELESAVDREAGYLVAGEREAAENLALLLYGAPYVRASISRVLFDDVDVEDALQETIVAVVESIGRFKGDSRYSTWVSTIARNKAIDVLARKQRQRDAAGAAAPPTSFEQFSSLLAGQLDVAQLIAELPPRLAEVARLRELRQFSYAEIAEQLDLPVNTVRSRLARARARMSRSLLDNNSVR